MKDVSRWYSHRTQHELTLVRWGAVGEPVLLFPTAGGDAEEVERFGLVDSVAPLLEAGRVKIYSIDSIAGRAWLQKKDPFYCARLQNAFDEAVVHEVVPAIRADCESDGIEVITAGASIGAFNAVASLCRHPEIFRAAVAMSGTYDLEPWLQGQWQDDFYFASPLHFLPNLGDGEQLRRLRERFVLLAMGEGPWEKPEESWRLADVLGSKGIPNRVDAWGPGWDHDWPTWRAMLPKYLDELT